METDIRRTLVVSTGHLTRRVAYILQGNDHEFSRRTGLCWDPVEYGWLVRNVHTMATDKDYRRTCPRCLRDVIDVAHARKCDYVLFDCDAVELGDLKLYDW